MAKTNDLHSLRCPMTLLALLLLLHRFNENTTHKMEINLLEFEKLSAQLNRRILYELLRLNCCYTRLILVVVCFTHQLLLAMELSKELGKRERNRK